MANRLENVSKPRAEIAPWAEHFPKLLCQTPFVLRQGTIALCQTPIAGRATCPPTSKLELHCVCILKYHSNWRNPGYVRICAGFEAPPRALGAQKPAK